MSELGQAGVDGCGEVAIDVPLTNLPRPLLPPGTEIAAEIPAFANHDGGGAALQPPPLQMGREAGEVREAG